MPRVIKQDGRRQPFDEDKLRAGLQRALEKRPVSVEQIEAAIGHIKHRLRATGEREVKALAVGEMVMRELKQLDEVAYIRFASVYRRFQDLNQFREEIERLAIAVSVSRFVADARQPLLSQHGPILASRVHEPLAFGRTEFSEVNRQAVPLLWRNG